MIDKSSDAFIRQRSPQHLGLYRSVHLARSSPRHFRDRPKSRSVRNSSWSVSGDEGARRGVPFLPFSSPSRPLCSLRLAFVESDSQLRAIDSTASSFSGRVYACHDILVIPLAALGRVDARLVRSYVGDPRGFERIRCTNVCSLVALPPEKRGRGVFSADSRSHRGERTPKNFRRGQRWGSENPHNSDGK